MGKKLDDSAQLRGEEISAGFFSLNRIFLSHSKNRTLYDI